MKQTLKITLLIFGAAFLVFASCKKKDTPKPSEPITTGGAGESEVITTFKLILKDSASNVTTVYMFKDPDGDGGTPPFYGPTSSTQTDSIIGLQANTTYYGEIILLDETKNPVDSVSKAVNEEGKDHMFFFNHGMNAIVNSGNPYTVVLNGSNVKVTYTDLDAGTTQRGIGLKTKWRTYAGTGSVKHKLMMTLRHQPDSKDGTFAPGETDIEVFFKLLIN
jgi:hypothetical protein